MESNPWFNDDKEYFYHEFEEWEKECHHIVIPEDPDGYEAYHYVGERLIEPGMIKVYPGASYIFQENNTSWYEYVRRHVNKDYGDLGEDDKLANEFDLANGGRALSRYNIGESAIYVETWPGYYTSVVDVWER